MNNIIKKLLGKAKQLNLDPSKKEEIRANMLAFMRQNPLPSKANIGFFAKYRALNIAGISAILLVAIFTFTALRANSAMPGDLLYPIKVGFNEPLVLAFTVSADQKTALNMDFAEKRLQEAETLLAQGKLSGSAQSQVEESFKKLADNVEKDINALAGSGNVDDAAKKASKFEVTLRAHGKVLKSLDGNVEKIEPLVSQIQNTTLKVYSSRNDLEIRSFKSVKTTEKEKIIQEKIIAAENSLEQAKKLSQDAVPNALSATLSAPAGAAADDLVQAEEKISEVKNKIKNKKDYDGSYSDIQDALIISQQYQQYVHEKSKYEVNVKIQSQKHSN